MKHSMKHLLKPVLALFLFFAVAQVGYAQTIRNSSNSYLGKVYQDGTVRNSSNSVIGYAKDVPVRYAALYFFFDFFD